MRLLLRISLLAFLLAGMQCAYAQVTDPEEEEEYDTQASTPDVEKIDSVSLADSAASEVARRVLTINWDALQRGLPYGNEVSFRLADQVYSDALDRLPGFCQTLGQIGKPYRRYLYGFYSAWQDPALYINPMTWEEEAYMTSPGKAIQFLDSRTPFVNVQFTQGRRKYSVLDVTISRNISPYINAAAFYRKRLHQGPYENASTDHYNMWYSMRARTRDDRYHSSMALVFDQLKDKINGGIYQDDFDSLFFAKEGDITVLADALLERKHRAAEFRQVFQIIGGTHRADTTATDSTAADSLRPVVTEPASLLQLIAFHTFTLDEFRNQYKDAIGTSDNASSSIFPIYPTLTGSTAYELWRTNQWKSSQGLSWHSGDDTLGFHLLGAIDYGSIAVRDTFSETKQFTQYLFTQRAEAGVNAKTLHADYTASAEYRNTRSNLFVPEQMVKGSVDIAFLRELMDYDTLVPAKLWDTRDSVKQVMTHRPMSLGLRAISNNRNPSLFNTFNLPGRNNTFFTNPFLTNEHYTHYMVNLRFRGSDIIVKDQLLPHSYFTLGAFTSAINRMVWYNTDMQLWQAPDGQSLRVNGVEQTSRIRLRRFTLENRLTIQAVSNSDTTTTLWQDNHLSIPRSFGFIGFFYEQHGIKVANAVRAGVELHFQSSYHGRLFDPASQQFYSQTSFLMPSNTRVDMYAAMNIKKAYIFLKVLNVFEGSGKLGYFTTPFYAMPERSFQLGINWSFFD